MSTENLEEGEELTSLLLQASQISINFQRRKRKLADENAVLRQKVAELEEEVRCWRQSYDGTGQLADVKPFKVPCSISHLSIEILQIIFAMLLPQDNSPRCETPAWRDAFSAKYAVLRVCRLWYNSCIDRVYEHIHLSRLAQLPRLIRTLEASGTKELARSIKRIDLKFFVPKGWEMLYRQDLRRLLSLCPSILAMDHTLIYDAKPQLDPVIYATLAVFLDNITCLILGHDEMSFENQCRLFSSLTILRELEFHPGMLNHSPESYARVTLPHLISLAIFHRKETCRSIRCLTLWTIPYIRRLSVTIRSEDRQWQPVEAIQLLPGLCSAQGANLNFFSLDLSSIPSPSNLTKLFTHFPKIEHLAFYPAVEETLHYPTMPTLRQIDFVGPYGDGLQQHVKFIAESKDSHFPTLKVVRILDELHSLTPADYFIMGRPYLLALRDCTKIARTLGVELQNSRGDTLEIHRRYRMLDVAGDKVLEYEHEIDFEEESDDTYEPPTSDDEDLSSESSDSLSCASDQLEDGDSELEMDHDTVLRLWDEMRKDEGDDEMSDSSEWNDSVDNELET